MTEIVIYASAHEGDEREILRAACVWVRSIHGHPSQWAGEEEFELIRSVRRAYPDIRCRWKENPEYAGWKDSSDPT